jgi:TnpA family transposase
MLSKSPSIERQAFRKDRGLNLLSLLKVRFHPRPRNMSDQLLREPEKSLDIEFVDASLVQFEFGDR